MSRQLNYFVSTYLWSHPREQRSESHYYPGSLWKFTFTQVSNILLQMWREVDLKGREVESGDNPELQRGKQRKFQAILFQTGKRDFYRPSNGSHFKARRGWKSSFLLTSGLFKGSSNHPIKDLVTFVAVWRQKRNFKKVFLLPPPPPTSPHSAAPESFTQDFFTLISPRTTQ